MFAGRRFDIEIGLYYNRARYYNPFIGRFLQTDPIGYGDGMNLYAYCSNSPQTWVDPSGLWASYTFIWRPNLPQHVQVLCWDDAAQTHLATDFYFKDWGDLMAYVESGVGDFCDVDVDNTIPTISFTEDVPLHSTMRAIYTAMGLTSPSEREYNKIRTDVIIRNVEESGSRYFYGIKGKGEFDFKVTEDNNQFILPDGTELNGSDFSNYLAGYGAYYHYGLLSTPGVFLAGDFYAYIEKNVKAYADFFTNLRDDKSFLDSIVEPEGGTFFDEDISKYWIMRGIADALAKF